MKYAHTELKTHYKSITALLYLFIVLFALYVLVGSVQGIVVDRYENNAYYQALKMESDPTSNGRVAGATTDKKESSGYITEPSVLQLHRDN